MTHNRTRFGLGLVVLLAGCGVCAATDNPAAYLSMAPLTQYLTPDLTEEIALARSAAPPSIAANAEVRTLGVKGYDTAVKGSNGFVCIVVRAWANNFDSGEFWNSHVRAPHCFNAAAARTVLLTYLRRTQWALSGLSREEMRGRTQAALTAHEIQPPETGSMAYMLGKDGYLGDDVHGHWHPHVMFYLPRTAPSTWGANAKGSPVFADASGLEPVTVLFIPVAHWSDGTPDDTSH
jgi:hypothetical protein